MLRVIAGKFGGRKLQGSRGLDFRPTLDRVKESIFNTLGEDVVDREVGDFFCGTGSLGIEAISRGARRATFIDISPANLEIARKNAASLGIESQTEFIRGDIFNTRFRHRNLDFDLIFADPPYDLRCGERLMKLISHHQLLRPGGLFVYEHQAKEIFDIGHLKHLRKLKFGQTVVDIFLMEEKS